MVYAKGRDVSISLGKRALGATPDLKITINFPDLKAFTAQLKIDLDAISNSNNSQLNTDSTIQSAQNINATQRHVNVPTPNKVDKSEALSKLLQQKNSQLGIIADTLKKQLKKEGWQDKLTPDFLIDFAQNLINAKPANNQGSQISGSSLTLTSSLPGNAPITITDEGYITYMTIRDSNTEMFGTPFKISDLQANLSKELKSVGL